jgi:hypothetical protein
VTSARNDRQSVDAATVGVRTIVADVRSLGIRALHPRYVGAAVTSLPAWAAVITIWVAGRLLSTFWLAVAWPLIGQHQPANAIKSNDHGFFSFLTSWDGQYYNEISVHGYPSTLPVDSLGHTLQNAWAFLPAFPFTIRMLTASTGMPFSVGAPLVATIAGLVAAAFLYVLVRDHAGHRQALWAVFFFCVGPLSFLLEVGYAESMFLALTFAALVAMERRQYGVLTLLGVIAAFTRPGALAIPLTLGVVAIIRVVRIVRAQRARTSSARVLDSFPGGEMVVVALSAAIMTAAGFAWPLIAAHVTGVHDAYLRTEMSWWVGFLGRGAEFIPLTPWFMNSGRWLGFGGILLVLAMIAGYVVWLCRRSTRELGVTTIVFSAGYALYVFAVSLPMASTPRLLMPLSPLFGSRELVARPWARWIMIGGALVGQPICVAVLWLVAPP